MKTIKHWFDKITDWIYPSTERLIARLGDTGGGSAMRALTHRGRPAVEPLITALRDPRPLVCMYAAEALSQIQDARAVEPLIAALCDPRDTVRVSAVRALGQLGDARAVEPLIATLRDPNSDVISWAIEALVQIGDKRAVEPLLHLASSGDDPTVRAEAIDERAIKALGSLGDSEVLPKLELVRQRISEEYAANVSQGFLHPMAAEGLYDYFGVPLDAIDHAIAEIRARSAA